VAAHEVLRPIVTVGRQQVRCGKDPSGSRVCAGVRQFPRDQESRAAWRTLGGEARGPGGAAGHDVSHARQGAVPDGPLAQGPRPACRRACGRQRCACPCSQQGLVDVVCLARSLAPRGCAGYT